EKKWADESRQKLKEELESAEKEFAAFQKPLIAKAAEAIKRTDPQHDKEVTEKDVERLINVESNNAASLDKTSDVFTANEKQSYGRFSERIARIKKQIERLQAHAAGVE